MADIVAQALDLLEGFEPEKFDAKNAVEKMRDKELWGSQLAQALDNIAKTQDVLAKPAIAQAQVAEALAKSLPLEALQRLVDSDKAPSAVQKQLYELLQIRATTDGKIGVVAKKLGLDPNTFYNNPVKFLKDANEKIQTLPNDTAKPFLETLSAQLDAQSKAWQLAMAPFKYRTEQAGANKAEQDAAAAMVRAGLVLKAHGIDIKSGAALVKASQDGKFLELMMSGELTAAVYEALNKNIQTYLDTKLKIETTPSKIASEVEINIAKQGIAKGINDEDADVRGVPGLRVLYGAHPNAGPVQRQRGRGGPEFGGGQ